MFSPGASQKRTSTLEAACIALSSVRDAIRYDASYFWPVLNFIGIFDEIGIVDLF